MPRVTRRATEDWSAVTVVIPVVQRLFSILGLGPGMGRFCVGLRRAFRGGQGSVLGGLPIRNVLRGKAVAISENWPVWEGMGHL